MMSEIQTDDEQELLNGRLINSPRFVFCGGNMLKTTCDKKGRICLPSSVRSKYGGSFLVVEMPEKLVLLPMPDDPVKDLEAIGRMMKGRSVKELKDLIDEQAQREVGM